MIKPEEITSQHIIPLFISTFQGSSTQEIHEAYQRLMQIAKTHYNQFINTLQKILQTQSENIHICKSISNFIKVMSKIMTDEAIIDESGPKDFINKLEHLFDNKKISLLYKENIAFAYIKAALHFKQSFSRIIDRISYLYKTIESHHAVLLSRAYLSCDSRLQVKGQGLYYTKILPLEIKSLYQEILLFKKLLQQGNQQNFSLAKTAMHNIYEVLRNIHAAIVFIAFEKFESSIFSCLQSKEIVEIINSMDILEKNKNVMIILRQIVQKIIDSLFRMRRIEKIPMLMKALSSQLHQHWRKFQQALIKRDSLIYKGIYSQEGMIVEDQISKIKLLTAAFNSKIILIIDDKLDVLNVLVNPLVQIRAQLFQKDQQNAKEVFLLFEDVCFSMNSECLQVEFNKLIKTFLTNYEIISSKVYFTLEEILWNNSNLQEFLIEKQQTVLMLLSLLTFQASYFMTNDTLLHKIETFLKKYEQILFNKNNIELYFHALLVLSNYLDDLFCQDFESQIFQIISQNFIENRLKATQGYSDPQINLVTYFEKSVLKTFYNAGFKQKEIAKECQIVIKFLSDHFDDQGISVYIEIMKNYKIQDNTTLEVLDKMLEQISDIVLKNKSNLSTSHPQIHAFIKFLQVFFNLDIYKHLFESTMSRILPIFQVLISSVDLFEDEFFNLMKYAIKNLQYVPYGYLSWMANLFNSQKLESEGSFHSLVTVLKYLTPSQTDNSLNYEIFVNCLALQLLETIVKSKHSLGQTNSQNRFMNTLQQMSSSQGSLSKNQQQKQFFTNKEQAEFSQIQLLALLSLHQLIYYHCEYFTKKVLLQIITLSSSQIIPPPQPNNRQFEYQTRREMDFSFVRGKYQLVFVLLFRRRLNDVNQILFQSQIEKSVYCSVYMKDNQYLIEYDTPILIREQAQILKRSMANDKMQLTFANTSFLTIFHKFCLLFEIKSKNKQSKFDYIDMESSDSDEEDFQVVTDFKSDFKEVAKLIQNFPLPQEWRHVDELKEIKEFVLSLRSNESTKEWLNLIAQNCLTKQQRNLLENLMKDLQNVNGKYRQILKVNKNPSISPSRQNLEKDIEI